MARKVTKTSVGKRLDRLWSLEVRQRAGNVCVRCGRQPPYVLHAHHIIGRGNKTLRWDLRNGVSLCFLCHDWAETRPTLFTDWIRSVRPEDVAYVEEREKVITQRSLADLQELLQSFRDPDSAEYERMGHRAA